MDRDRREAAWVERAQEGDLGAFDLLAVSSRSDLQALARQVLRDGSFADDLVQETLLTAYKNLSQLDNPELVRPWMAAILRRRAWRWNQSPNPEPLPLNDLDLLLMRRSRELARTGSAGDGLEEAMRTLSEDQRNLIRLAAWDGFTTKEMSERTGLSEATVKWRLHEARKRLTGALKEEQ